MLQLVLSSVAQSSELIALWEFFLKSLGVFAVFAMIDACRKNSLSSANRHLLALATFVCVALLPFGQGLSLRPLQDELAPSSLFTLAIAPNAEPSQTDYTLLLWLLYVVPLSALFGRLLLGLWRLRAIAAQADCVKNPALLQVLDDARRALGISRPVRLSYAEGVCSPMSFGVFEPHIVLPVQAQTWGEPMLRHVLLHELKHIQRCDWISMMFAYGVASFAWMNPLAWRMLRQMSASAELACDAGAIRISGDGAAYAADLVGVARLCQLARRRAALFAQTMLERSSLETRVKNILEEKIMKIHELKKQQGRLLASVSLLSAALLFGFSSTNIVLAQSPDRGVPQDTSVENRGEFFPLEAIEPYYPRAAAEQGIEGWVHVRFTVGVDGTVAEDSIEVLDAQPADVFNASAIAAAARFRFSKYAPDGFSVIVPNVQYVFRYAMDD